MKTYAEFIVVLQYEAVAVAVHFATHSIAPLWWLLPSNFTSPQMKLPDVSPQLKPIYNLR